MLQRLSRFTAVCLIALAGALPAAGITVSSQQGCGRGDPTDGYSISGRINAASGVEVGGIAVSLEGYSIEMENESQGAITASATTTADGTYSFGDLEPGAYVVVPEQWGLVFTPARQGVSIRDASVTDIDFSGARATGPDSTVVPSLPAARYSISGTITAPPGVIVREIGIQAQLDLPGGMIIGVYGGNAFINMGEAAGIKRGTEVVVYTVAKGPRDQYIGRVVVVDVQRDISRAGIIDNSRGLQTGDRVRALFSTNCLAGGAYTFRDLAPGAYTLAPIAPLCFTPTKQVVVVRNANVTGINFAGVHASGANSTAVEPPPASNYSISGTISGPPGFNVAGIRLQSQLDLPGGAIIAAAHGLVYINLGKESGIERGTELGVYSVAKGSLDQYIGRLVVLEAQQGISQAQIVDGVRGLSSGDRVRPVFSATCLACGAYTLRDLGPGVYTVIPMQHGLAFTPDEQVVAVREADVTGLNFTAAVPAAPRG